MSERKVILNRCELRQRNECHFGTILAKCQNITTNTESFIDTFIQKHRLDDAFNALINKAYLPIIQKILEWQALQTKPLLIGVNGAQGTGKTTFSYFVAEYISDYYGLNTVVLSLDDFYKTKSERIALADAVHPLLKTRGAPGTHDLSLAFQALSECLDKKLKKTIRTPRFRKEIDDRADPCDWHDIQAPVDIVLFEGWCVSARPETQEALKTPINSLEEKEDAQGIWRAYVNDCLASTYADLFTLLDYTIMLKAPNFDQIIEWRMEQENKLRESSKSLKDVSKHHYMSQDTLKYFIAHYERLTQSMLHEMPNYADIVLSFNPDRSFKKLLEKNG